MKLYIKQKVFSWSDRFTVKDIHGEDRYYVEGELFSWGKKLHVYDMAGNEVAFIQQKVFSFLPRYFVYVNGEEIAEIVKEFTFFFPKYSIAGLGWDIEGSFMAHDYQITHRDHQQGVDDLGRQLRTGHRRFPGRDRSSGCGTDHRLRNGIFRWSQRYPFQQLTYSVRKVYIFYINRKK